MAFDFSRDSPNKIYRKFYHFLWCSRERCEKYLKLFRSPATKKSRKERVDFSGDLSCDPFISVDLTREEEKLNFSSTLRERRDEKGEKGGKSFLFFHSITFAEDHHSRSFISFFFARRYTKKQTYTQHSAIFAEKHK